MDQNLSQDFLNQEKIEYNHPCERCKKDNSTLICKECKPFHYFCNQCDTSIHNLPSRKSHQRIEIDSFQNYSNTQKTNRSSNSQTIKKNIINTPKNFHHYSLSLNYNNISTQDNIDINDNNYQNNNLESNFNGIFYHKIPKLSTLNHSYSYLYNKNGKTMCIGANDCKKIYSKDYVNELKIMHNKEKDELIYKITLLENTIIIFY